MRKIYRSAAAAMMVFAAASCQNEDIQVQQDIQGQEFILEATFGAPTRTTLEKGTSGYQTVWSEGDQIYVCSADGRSKGILTLSQGAGKNSGKFRGFVSGDASQIEHAIFPVPKNGVIDLSNVDAGEVDAPMTASVSGGNADFTNACAMIKLNIVNIESDEVVKLTCDKQQDEVELLGGLFKIVHSGKTSISGIASGEDFFVPINYSGALNTTEDAKVEVFIGNATEGVEMDVLVGTGLITVNGVPDMVVVGEELINPTDPDADMPENMVYVTSDDDLTVALNNKEIENIVLAGNTTFTTKIHPSFASGRNSLNIIGSKGTKVQFAENVDVSHIGKFEIQNCEILKRTNKWGMLLMGSQSTGIKSVVKITNCDFKGVGTQGIYINEVISGVVYDIEKCTFDGDFGGEGAITIQNNKIDFTVNVNGCTFNNIPKTSHKVFVAYNNPFALNTDLADSDIHWNEGKPSAE